MESRTILASLLALGAATVVSAFGGGPGGHGKGHRPDGPRPCLRDSATGCPRAFAALTDEQKAFLQSERSLRDSMFQAVHGYSESVRKGSDPRSLVLDRARIHDYATRLERLRTTNLDVWLDLQAVRPGPFHGGRRPRQDSGAAFPPPPPPEADSDSTASP